MPVSDSTASSRWLYVQSDTAKALGRGSRYRVSSNCLNILAFDQVFLIGKASCNRRMIKPSSKL